MEGKRKMDPAQVSDEEDDDEEEIDNFEYLFLYYLFYCF